MYANDEKCQRFARNLKALRESRGWTQEKLAAEAKVSKGIVANTESFQRPPLEDHGIAYDVAFGLEDVFAKAAREIQGDSVPVAFQDFPAHEATAHDLYAYQHSLFPGLIQTERYMRAVFATLPNPTPEEIERLAAGRLKRQEILYRAAPSRPDSGRWSTRPRYAGPSAPPMLCMSSACAPLRARACRSCPWGLFRTRRAGTVGCWGRARLSSGTASLVS